MKTKQMMMLTLAGLLAVNHSALAMGKAPKKSPTMKMTTPIPESITTPDNVQTSIGSLEFFDGVPTGKTTESVNMPQSIIMPDGKKEMIL